MKILLHLYENLGHAFVITAALTNFITLFRLLHSEVPASSDIFLFSWVQSAHRCVSHRSFNKCHAILKLLHDKVDASRNFCCCFHVREALIHALMSTCLKKY